MGGRGQLLLWLLVGVCGKVFGGGWEKGRGKGGQVLSVRAQKGGSCALCVCGWENEDWTDLDDGFGGDGVGCVDCSACWGICKGRNLMFGVFLF